MKILFLDCGMGAAGDMLAGALLELMPDRGAALEQLNALGLPGVRFCAESAVWCGITGTHLRVTVEDEEETEHLHEHGHSHVHHGLADITHIVRDHLALPEPVRQNILAVFQSIAQAESRVHGVPVEQIHFHEVGTMDAVADVAAVCLLLHALAPDEIVCTPVCTGFGQVRCAHGILPVPAPATALLLEGVPVYAGDIESELCTPTGAALLRHFVTRFAQMPGMVPEAVGYGMGRKEFSRANCVRAVLGQDLSGQEDGADEVAELCCQVDDMTGEAVGFAVEALMKEGALDVWTVPVGMKKSRPGLLLELLCRPADRARMVRLLFLHTTTLGVRETLHRRYVLQRETTTLDTPWGPVRQKVSAGFGVRREKYEYDDLARIAAEEQISLDELRRRLDGQTETI